VERKAPGRAEWESEQAVELRGAGAERSAGSPAPRRILPRSAPRAPDPLEHEILIVSSKLKAYVRGRSGFHTSDQVMDSLSDAVRALCDRAIEKAREEGRRTVLDRDFE